MIIFTQFIRHISFSSDLYGLMMISSDLGLYIVLFKTGFFWTHGIFLILVKVLLYVLTGVQTNMLE